MRTRLTLLSSLLCSLAVIPAPAPAQPPAQPQPAKATGLEAVPTDAFMFVTANVGKLWDNPSFKPLRDWFLAQKVGPSDDVFGVAAADIERVTMFITSADNANHGSPLVLVTTKKPYNEAKVLKALSADDREVKRHGRAIRIHDDKFQLLVFVDDRTLLFLSKVRDNGASVADYLGQMIAKKTDGPLAEALADATKHDIALAVDARHLEKLFDATERREFAPYLALFKARTLTFAADFNKNAQASFKLGFANEADAKRAGPVLKEGIADLAENIQKELDRRKERDKTDSAERQLLENMVTVLKAAKVESGDKNVFAVAEVPYADAVAKFAAALPKSYSAEVTSMKGQNNLKQLALGMLNFESAIGRFPSDSIAFGNKTLAMSWRVQILPYIEQDNLYKQLDQTKPWDDPANVKILERAEMPKVFEIPGRPAPKGHTYFRVFSLPKNAKGKDRPFFVEGQAGPKITEVTDGLSNTFMIVEAADAVPWYKPDVLAYDGELPLPQLGDKAADKFLVAFGDGSVKSLKRSKLDEKTLRALITINGGEPVTLPER